MLITLRQRRDLNRPLGPINLEPMLKQEMLTLTIATPVLYAVLLAVLTAIPAAVPTEEEFIQVLLLWVTILVFVTLVEPVALVDVKLAQAVSLLLVLRLQAIIVALKGLV